MSNEQDGEAEKPLDPATERVRRKMVRLLVVSIGIMVIGLMAVLAAVVYRSVGGEETGLPQGGETLAIALPAGARILDTSIEGDRALLHVEGPAGTSLVLVSLADGKVLATYQVEDTP